jgi:3',5'-cyclic AMP phosphodiesterase CpdA
VALLVIANAQEKPLLKFKCDGTFKIVQFSDTHYKWGKKKSNRAVECIIDIVDREDPDLVIFTGDQVYADGVANALTALTQPLVERGIAFASVFGNHDFQFDMTRPAMYDLMQGREYSVMPPRGNVDSPDYVLPIYSSDGRAIKEVLYLMDTHDATAANATGQGRYDWLTAEQIDWYRQLSADYTSDNEGTPIPSLLFIHIPLPEYLDAVNAQREKLIGNCREKVCCSGFNSGMFDALKQMGDITAVFCGHDHDNDFITVWQDIILAYGRYSGGKTVYNHLGKPGARVIVLNERHPNAIHTWIETLGGAISSDFSR